MLPAISPRTIAIIGAGASGTLLAAHLLRSATRPIHIFLIELRPFVGRGIAYGTTNVQHLLNVPAAKMSAYPELPDDFLHWLTRYAHSTGEIATPSATSFVPRYLYAIYLQETLEEARKNSLNGTLQHVHEEVLKVRLSENTVLLETKGGRCLCAHEVILATGNSEPHSPPVATPDFYGSVRYHRDPWAPSSEMIPPSASVLLLGSSLTMIDVVLALKAQGHTDKLFSVSRHGIVPFAHHVNATLPIQLTAGEPPTSLRAVLRWLRVKSHEVAQAKGDDWRNVVDALRPHIQVLWQSWSEHERQQFLCHVQPYWDARRHRIAPIAAQTIAQMQATKQLQVYAGRVQRYEEMNNVVAVTMQLRGTRETRIVHVQHVINCTGPSCDIREAKSPVLADMFAQGLIRPDVCFLGIDTTINGAVIDRDGVASSRIYALGPLRKGTLWETTAIPEIRVQAAQLAYYLLATRDHHGVQGDHEGLSNIET